MNILQVEKLLSEHNFTFDKRIYKNANAFFSENFKFFNRTVESENEIAALIIKSNNRKTNIVLQFNKNSDVFVFYNMYFGCFDFELFNTEEECLEDSILNAVSCITAEKHKFIAVYNLKSKKMIFDCRLDLSEHEEKEYYQDLKMKIDKTKSFLKRLIGAETMYEEYDWDSYSSLIK